MASERKIYKLGDISSLSYGKMPKKEKIGKGDYPIYSGYRYHSTYPEFNVKSGDVIVVARGVGGTGNVKLVKEKSYLTNLSIKIHFEKSDISKKYFYYLFLRNNLKYLDTGSAQSQITINDLKSLNIKLPLFKEQKAIAHILGTLDDKIELNRKMNETLEEMAQALFKSWFVDFDPVLDKALAAGHEIPEPLQANAEKRKALGDKRKALPQEIADLFPDRFVFTEELGWVPEGWEISNIGNEFNVTMGQSPPGSTYNENGEGIRFFQGKADFGFRYPTDRIYCSEPKRFASKGDTLMSVRAPVGDVNIALNDCSIGRGLCAIRHKSSSKSYTYYFMKHKKAILDSYESGGTVFGSINQKQLKSLEAFGNIESIISAFHKIASSQDEKIELNSRELLSLSKIRDTLLPKLISGELKVPEVEEIVEDI
ncbi:restriction endonuclease subunit S [Marivirga sp.]|uniref:restriction endonuclease subunit S n=1 Tax=Marivirga sp. TaxID=2018662 RepID=UPI003DA77003